MSPEERWWKGFERAERDPKMRDPDEAAEFSITVNSTVQIPSTERRCWASLFDGCVVARGFPAPERGDEIGLELPFDMMTEFSSMSYMFEYPKGLAMRGYSSILIPQRETRHGVQWHYVHKDPKQGELMITDVEDQFQDAFRRNPVQEPMECTNVSPYDPETNRVNIPPRRDGYHPLFVDFSTKRAFLGHSTSSLVYLGARNLETGETECGTIRPTDAGIDKSTWIAREAVSTLVVPGMGILGANLQAKFIVSKATSTKHFSTIRQNLLDRLTNAKNRNTIVVDVGTKQAYYVSELSVVLEALHIWAKNREDEALLEIIPRATPSPDGGNASYNAIFESRGALLVEGLGNEKDVHVADQVHAIMDEIELRKDCNLSSQEEGARVRTFLRSGRRLYGWDLFDVALGIRGSSRKFVDVDPTRSGNWVTIPEVDKSMIVLFTQGLKQPIRPASSHGLCRTWNPLPEQRFLLLASIPCILRKCSQDNPKLSEFHHCVPSPQSKLFEPCEFDHGPVCYRAQHLDKKVSTQSLDFGSAKEGSVIFGGQGTLRRPVEGHCMQYTG
ncbi:hypothetical protein P152DRAFT_340487 [Eremomyces bilateralis CBS 781.70]|uniref:Uncharacterized protein n=1 Tax=Eremomyces bilateralis CBS 781.70 TaxID=1392243 RepID=A0A6G1G340_9PEZI|nr:uncharacterized protein P152DRAFT_340487 [Eremomyces bilateralis CBS 781.70]KAF1812474.1 hypothetical protein P152DRAFT_340487 [Eremomyces bilateralis CBS 781.70]